MKPKDPKKDDLLEDDPLATTGVVQIAQEAGKALEDQCTATTTKVKKKFETLRRKISGTYSLVRPEEPPPDRPSRPS